MLSASDRESGKSSLLLFRARFQKVFAVILLVKYISQASHKMSRKSHVAVDAIIHGQRGKHRFYYFLEICFWQSFFRFPALLITNEFKQSAGHFWMVLLITIKSFEQNSDAFYIKLNFVYLRFCMFYNDRRISSICHNV